MKEILENIIKEVIVASVVREATPEEVAEWTFDGETATFQNETITISGAPE